VDLLQWWLGPVKSLIGAYGTRAHNIESEDMAAGILQFESGATGVLVTTTTAFPDQGTRLEIGGDRGTLAWQDQDLTLFRAVQGDAGSAGEWDRPEAEDLTLEDFPAPDDLPPHIIADVVGAIREGKPVQCSGHEGRKSVAIFEGVYRSFDEGRPVEAP